jgi:Putative DNA-binding domain
MKLASLQKAVARAVMHPLTRKEHMRTLGPRGVSMRRYAARFIKPNDRLTSFERLEIYSQQYWFRLLGALAEDFPGLRAILGERRFEAMCRAYLTECPSRSYTLRNLGSRLEHWLQRNPQWTRGRKRLALDMVRLEWADIEAFDREAEPVLKPDDLAGAPGKFRLRLQPYIQLLTLHYPADDLVLQVKDGEGATDFASNAVLNNRKRSQVRAVASLAPREIYLVVHRIDCSVYFRRIEREAHTVLTALRAGETVASAIEVAFKNSSVAEIDRANNVRHWFETWAALGWLCVWKPQVRGKDGKLV